MARARLGHPRTVVLVLVGLTLGSCTKKGFLEAPEVDDEVAQKVGSFGSDTHFLLEPTGDAESLLGRQVHVSSNGAWTIADERAPDCAVRVKRSNSKYKKKYRVDLDDLTVVEGGYAYMLRLKARYGRSIEAEFEIANTETLSADVEGPCGEVIVKSVRVGSGFRRLLRNASGSTKAGAGIGPLGAEGGREGKTEVHDSIEWEEPQAYAFAYGVATTERELSTDPCPQGMSRLSSGACADPGVDRGGEGPRRTRGLTISGGGLVGAAGVAFFGMFVGGYVQTNSLERKFDSQCYLTEPLFGTCRDLYDRGKRADGVATAGLIITPLLLSSGITLLILAARRKASARHTLVPTLSPGLLGWSWRYQF